MTPPQRSPKPRRRSRAASKKARPPGDAKAELREALAQQAATSEILQIISRSRSDVQPVFDAIARKARELCKSRTGAVYTFDGELIHAAAHHRRTSGLTPEQLESLRKVYPTPPGRGGATARAILTRAIVYIPDIREDSEYQLQSLAQVADYLSVLAVPMLHEGEPIGAIAVSGVDAGAFSERQIELLKTFADQAVIAIENVRLFTELQGRNQALTAAHAQVTEALDQQTATSEILRVISSSPTDVQPVFDAIVASAVRLCEARYGAVFSFDGELVHLVAHRNFSQAWLEQVGTEYPMRPTATRISGRAILNGSIVQIPDVAQDQEYGSPNPARLGFRSLLAIPILRSGVAIGAIVIYRPEPGPFSDKHIGLLKIFADQAVIAIENVRLFTELQEKNLALTTAHAQVTEALDQQTATSEILRVISSSPTDVQPVFEAIAASATRLCEASNSGVFRFDGDLIHLVAHDNWDPQALAAVQRAFPRPPGRGTATARAILTRSVVHIPDVTADPEFTATSIVRAGFRSELSVPMLRDDQPIGAIIVNRMECRPFTEQQIALLKTFADQAVIAIENVRLFTELQEKNQALTAAHAQVTEALDQQTATSEILRVISRSPTDVQPVFDIIAARAVVLCDADLSAVSRCDGELIHLTAIHGVDPEGIEAARRAFPMTVDSETVTARAVRHRAVAEIPNIPADPAYVNKDIARVMRYQSALGVPMIREGQVIGVIFVARTETGRFPTKQIELLKTFADQAVIAIENVRLFQELETRTQELGRSIEELQALGEVSRAISSTLDLETVLSTIVARAVQLASATGGFIYEYDETKKEFNRISGAHQLDDELGAVLRAAPMKLGEGAAGRAAATRAPVQIPDMLAEGAYDVVRIRTVLERRGYRSTLAVPLLFEQRIVGVLVIWRHEYGHYAPEVVHLLQTFASQSVLAIRNAQLYRELEEKGRQLEAASRHKSEFLANMSHELRTPLNAILGFNEMILGEIYGDVSPTMREPLTDIQNSGKHLLRLINNVLDLSKIEAGRMELSPADYSVQDIVERVRASLHPLAAEKGLEFVATVPADIPLAYGDGGRITQCLMNLAGNALKFTRQGRVTLSVELQGQLLVYHVADTGIGIAKDKIDSLFTEFRQGDATITSEFGGTGLGLSISRKFVEMHGGRVWVESELGKGSTFSFSVPLRLVGGKAA